MKKFLTTMLTFVALALTACGGNGGESKGGNNGWETDKNNHWHVVNGEVADKAKHDFVEDTAKAVAATCKEEGKKVEVCSVCGYVKETTIKKLDDTFVDDTSKTSKPATCSEEGIKYLVCSVCGEAKEEKIAKTDHDFGDWVNDASAKCGEAGSRSRKCKNCDYTETETLGIIPHDWDLEHAQTVAASGDGVEYTTAKCKKCSATGYFVAAAKATLSSNAQKKTAPEGCIKMSPDGAYMTVSFVLDAAKTGVFWLRGAMDYWYEDSNNNQNKTYSQNSGHTDASTKTGNFKLEVGPDAENLTNVELPDNTDLTFADMLPETVGSNEGGHQWSVIGDCIVGAASLAAGLNMIKFTRVDSYNSAVHDFLFVVPAEAI